MKIIMILLKDIVTFLNNNEGALMVIITLIYVIATIRICRANIKAADAAREQLVESKRQFEETRRLEIMPYFELDIVDDSSLRWESDVSLFISEGNAKEKTVIGKKLVINNIGLGNAKDFTYVWKNLNGSYRRHDLQFSSISAGGKREITIDFYAEHQEDGSEYEAQVSFLFHYCDLLENMYQQELLMIFQIGKPEKVTLKTYKAGAPVLLKEAKNA